MPELGCEGSNALPVVGLRQVLDCRFRSNADFELVALDDLPGGYRLLARRSGPRVSAKALNADAVELVDGLRVAGQLPGGTRTCGGAAANMAVARLVLDGALEIEDGDHFVSGPAAHPALFEKGPRPTSASLLASVSWQAIRYGEALAIADVGVLSRRMYGYGSVPRGPRWDQLLGPADDITGLLGLGPDGRAWRVLDHGYQAQTHANWLAWARVPDAREAQPALPFKLYISPRPEALTECFPLVATVLADHGVWSFKIGRGILGLLRPDKLIAYFEDFEHLERVTAVLVGALSGCAAHGVPFTVEGSPDGLLSWGMDPPLSERLLSAQPRESWRYWLTNRLAAALAVAQASNVVLDASAFALDRLSLDGVDPSTWLPSEMDWRRS